MRLATVLATVIVLALPGAARAAAGLELAVQDDPVLLHRSYSDRTLALDRAVELGADRIRVNLEWARAMPDAEARAAEQPAAITWDFSRLEELWSEADARGLPLQVTLTGPAPAWATGDGELGNHRPSARAFRAFAAAAARAFAGRIDRWSIWNEPNWHRLLAPAAAAPGIYRSLYRAGYRAIKQADPGVDVLFGELMPGVNPRRSTQALKFLRAVACANRHYGRARRCEVLRADGFAMHPYNFARRPRDAKHPSRDTVEIGSLSRLTRALARLHRARLLRTPGGRTLPVYLTEFGYFTEGPVARDPQQHAAWMTEAWNIARRNRHVRQLLQYELIDPWTDDVTWRTALMERDGTPRPVYYALQRAAAG